MIHPTLLFGCDFKNDFVKKIMSILNVAFRKNNDGNISFKKMSL